MQVALRSIKTVNIQNHREVIIDLPETGLVVFTGENSNGKSVIFRTTKYIISDKIQKPRIRAALVNRQAQFGEITYTRSDGVQLLVHIQREAAGTYVVYTEPDADPLKRYLADKTYRDLVARFGFHYDKDSGISLNIGEAEEAMLFYKTPYKVNRSVVETATSDTSANTALENLQMFLSQVRKWRDNYITQFTAFSQASSQLKVEDVTPLASVIETLTKCKKNLESVYIPTIPDIEPVPKVSYVSLYAPTIPAVKYPTIVNTSCSIPDITPVASELESLRNEVCPTCGRRFCEC